VIQPDFDFGLLALFFRKSDIALGRPKETEESLDDHMKQWKI
jgi:hypothetical protein